MKSKNKFIFESFQEFVENVLQKVEAGEINEAEGVADLKKAESQVVGDLDLKGQSEGRTSSLFDEMAKYIGDDKEMAKRVNDGISKGLDRLTNPQKGVTINKQSSMNRTSVSGRYEYLYANMVMAENFPTMALPNKSDMTRTSASSSKKVELFALLGAVNAYNIEMFKRNVNAAARSDSFIITSREARLYGGEAPKNEYLYLEDADGRSLKFTTKTPERQDKPDSYTISFGVPLYAIRQFSAKAGGSVDQEIIEEVVEPAGTSVEIVDKPHNSSGTDFFKENEVVISGEGMNALKALVSEYNEITKIVVNGSASSKPTSREGGNEQLAKDRMAAGKAALEEMKKTAVQLKNAVIEDGTATVQDGDPSESDASFQQVSFVVSGKAKASRIIDKEPQVILKVDDIKADAVTFWKYTMEVKVDGNVENV